MCVCVCGFLHDATRRVIYEKKKMLLGLCAKVVCENETIKSIGDMETR